MKRMSWDEYFLEIASVVAYRGTCIRRVYGAVIVKDNRIISTGYNGAPHGDSNCIDIGLCTRQDLKIPAGERYELCRAVHAEANAIIYAHTDKLKDSTIYISGWNFDWSKPKYDTSGFLIREHHGRADSQPCKMCTRMIKNAKIKDVVWRTASGEIKKELAINLKE